ncbi:MAG: DUF547 domain-containing protein [Candidatus Krumholzibacteriia bacterium]
MKTKTTILVATVVSGMLCWGGCAGHTGRIQPAASGIDTGAAEAHEALSAVLRKHVREGGVDYAALCGDARLPAYLARVAATDPGAIPDADSRLAFWLNAYNAFTLQVICDNYPVGSINDLHFGGLYVGSLTNKTIWDREFIVINGEELSLNDIEHKIVRRRFGDPRAHFALVCASKSCPALRAEAFEGQTLGEQLDEQARLFFSEEQKNHFDIENKTAHLSRILDWYAGDFGDSNEAILLFVARYVSDPLAAAIQGDPAAWDIKHTDYDWSLNEQSRAVQRSAE